MSGHSYSDIFLNARDFQVAILTVVLEPGDTLFLPNGWWHHVTSMDSPCISVSSSRWLPMFHEVPSCATLPPERMKMSSTHKSLGENI
jgi:ribosomal protein L16 Arg81 hydroxylase